MMWLNFIRQLMPDLMALGRLLYEHHGGDVAAAKAEISVIRDHGARLAAERQRIDRELAELHEKSRP